MKDKNYEGIWIPASTLNDKDLTIHQKIVLAMITNLSTDTEPCFASNEYFAKILGISAKNVSVHINNLKAIKRVTTKLIRDDKARVVRREIRATYQIPESGRGYPRNRGEGIPETVNQLSDENLLNVLGEEILKDSKEYNKDYNKGDKHSQIVNGSIKKPKTVKDEESVFELFWNTIPQLRRINKLRTRVEWNKALHKKSGEELVEAMELFVQRVEPKYIKTSFLWLKNEYWNAVPDKTEKLSEAFRYRQ